MATIKKSFTEVHAYLTANPDITAKELLDTPSFTDLMEAKKGGFSGVDSFVTIKDQKVARICAMTGAVFAHDNTDKEASFFYKNGSYMIGAEVIKSNARKEYDIDLEASLLSLEDDMLNGTITPKEWKEQTTALNADVFEFSLDDDTKQSLIADFEGYATKEEFITAYNDQAVRPFSDFADEIAELRALAPQKPTEDEEA